MEGPEFKELEQSLQRESSVVKEVGPNRQQRRRAKALGKARMRLQPTKDDPIPDRVSVQPRSAYFDARCNYLGIRFDGVERNSVVEYCLSEGWVIFHTKNSLGKPVKVGDEYVVGRPVYGKVEAYWR